MGDTEKEPADEEGPVILGGFSVSFFKKPPDEKWWFRAFDPVVRAEIVDGGFESREAALAAAKTRIEKEKVEIAQTISGRSALTISVE